MDDLEIGLKVVIGLLYLASVFGGLVRIEPERYLPTGWCEATDAGWGGSKCNEGLRGVMKADSLMA